MDFKIQAAEMDGLAAVSADALVVVLAGDALPKGLDAAVAKQAQAAIKLGDFALKAGQTLTLLQPEGLKAQRLVLAAAGRTTLAAGKAALAAALGQLKSRGAVSAAVAFLGFAAELVESLAEQAALVGAEATYLYRHTKPSAPAAPKLAKLALLTPKADAKAARAGLARGEAIAAGITLARECANRPGNHATPTYLGEVVQALGKSHGLKVEVLDKKAVEKLGMGSFLSVAQGSDEPLRFIVARYEGAPKTQAPVVLVGKGITFDSGGISLKPGAGMDEMKFDMGGAASVLGVFRALGEIQPAINVVGLIPSCENMNDGRAVKPGDVVTSMDGQTIEILNTDAEGRLILCDALTYAKRFSPKAVIDIATLTGACVVALGGVRSGLFSSDDALAEALQRAGENAQDRCWRMPLDDEYAEGLKTRFADVANVAGRAGGAITAAKFLQRFTADFAWAHLDIAGTAWKSGAAKGATGRPVGLLLDYLLSQAAAGAVPTAPRKRARKTPAPA